MQECKIQNQKGGLHELKLFNMIFKGTLTKSFFNLCGLIISDKPELRYYLTLL